MIHTINRRAALLWLGAAGCAATLDRALGQARSLPSRNAGASTRRSTRPTRGWTVVEMKRDWKTIFPP
jgi:hypothetical protein